MLDINKIYQGHSLDILKTFPNESVQCVVTSPPYFSLRSYLDTENPNKHLEIGFDNSLQEYITNLTSLFSEIHRVLRKDGTFWLNLGDTYAGNKLGNTQGTYSSNLKYANPEKDLESFRKENEYKKTVPMGLKSKDLIGVPWRVAFALQDAGWYLRSDIIWAKSISFNSKYTGSCLPESCKDRPTKSHEYLFLLTKSPKYFYDKEAVQEKAQDWGSRNRDEFRGGTTDPKLKHHGLADCDFSASGRNLRSVWTVNPKPFKGAHFATFPEKLIEPCIKAGTSEYGCCVNCGKPYKRITVKGNADEEHKKTCGADSNGEYLGLATKDYDSARAQNASEVKARILAGMVKTKTTGWKKDCKCLTNDIKPCVVLDPFFGAGTTGVVSKKLGRSWVGIDLNPEYCEIARTRINEVLI